MDEARERFGELVAIHQRRASRIAYQYLRDAAEADEAVQDAFVKVFSHITSYREAWPFEVWFTRILINGCLDRRKARARRDRWFVAGEITQRGRSARAFGGRRRRPIPSAAAGARAARPARRGHRSARRPPAHRLHAVPLRRLHAARSQRDDRAERIDRARPPVPRRAQAARRSSEASRDRPRAPSPRRAAVRLLSRRARRRAARSAGRRAPGRLRRVRARATPSSPRSWTRCAREGDAEADAVFTRRAPARAAAADRAAPRARRPPGARHQLPRRVVRRTIAASTVADRRRAGSPAAAAAGLFVGVARRRVVRFEHGATRRAERADRPCAARDAVAARRRASTPAGARPSGAAPTCADDDDAFLSELELALERPRTRELHARSTR